MTSLILRLIMLFLAITGAAGSLTAQAWPDSLNIFPYTYNGKNYEVVMNKHTWDLAALNAKNRGGHLIHIDSQAEQDSAYHAILNGAGISTTYTTVIDGGGIAYVWIGGSDIVFEGTWQWDGDNDSVGIQFWTGQGAAGQGGGSPFGGAFVNWGGKSNGTFQEPDDYNFKQDAAAIALAGWPSGTTLLGVAGEWNDIDINNPLYYIIEYENVGFEDKSADARRLIIQSNDEGYIHVSIEGQMEPVTCVMLSMSGQTIGSFTISQYPILIDTRNLAAGLYVIKPISSLPIPTGRFLVK